jgi:hypothetical protein
LDTSGSAGVVSKRFTGHPYRHRGKAAAIGKAVCTVR